MAKANSDALKKHHFWILLGVVPVLVLVAVVVVTASVGGAINTKVAAYEGAQKEIDGKQAVKPNAAIAVLDKQKDELEVKKTDLWKENWEKQIGVYYAKGPDGKPEAKQDPAANLFRWPASPVLARFAYNANYATDKNQLKFGDSLQTDTNDELNAFKVRDVYMAEFTNPRPGAAGTGMVDLVAPTEFLNNNWRSVLRHVYFPDAAVGGASGWGNRLPSSEQVWLALEDIWVQRALLGQIKAVNDTIGAFRDARLFDANKQEIKDDRRRAFESRNWRVELEIAPDPDDKDRRLRIGGRVTNRTDRLQPFGAGAALVLNVYLNDETAKPYVLKVPGQFVKGRATVPIAKLDEHLFAPGTKADKIVKVEQVFDSRTVPVRRIDAIAATGLPVIVPVTFPKAPNVSTPEGALAASLEDLLDWDIAPENPARLEKAGVRFALSRPRGPALRERPIPAGLASPAGMRSSAFWGHSACHPATSRRCA